MLDFNKGKFHRYRLSEVPFSEFETSIAPILLETEKIICTYKAGRDGVVFTTKRLIAIDNENRGKTDITCIPYSSIDVFSVETAGWLDRDSELDIYIKGIGKYCFEFDRATSIATVCNFISICKFN